MDDRDASLHEALGRWAEDHARRYPEVGVLEYDPASRPEQRIDTFKSAIRVAPGGLDGTVRALFEQTMGPAAANAVAALNEGPRDQLAAALEAGKSVVVLVSHAGGFEDMGVFPGALAVTLAEPALVARNGVIVNKVMTRETYGGHPIRDLYRPFANVYWVIPDTENAERWGLDDDTARYVNVNATRMLVGDMKAGVILSLAPGGSAMRQIRDSSGALVSLEIPEIGSGTMNLISRFDAYLCGAFWDDKIALGSIGEIPNIRAVPSHERDEARLELVAALRVELAALTERVAAVPVA